ncbi:preprotein translocase subunit SecY [Patescibacteria group bacterium]|nr:preprotein translocase subunit SecY [Patescibacteria group bacterium]MBU1922070.1 preprotein translocase subunit SecY [Patescibacteria group bacterium]
MWWNKLLQIWKIKDLRKNIIFVLLMLVVFRIGAHIPVPGINTDNLREFFDQSQLMGLLNLFSGGTMENFSIMALGIAPYITASIIFQLLTMIIPRLEQLSKEEGGRQKINQYTRFATVPLAALQSYAMIGILRQSQLDIIGQLSFFELFTIIITVTGGTIFLMWIGELISEKHIGNGISLLIFAGIISGLPKFVQQVFITFDRDQLFTFLVYAGIALVTVIGVVTINEAQRNIPVSYARRVRGMRMYGGMDTHLPLRVNMAGVIPIIFAISIILFPTMIAQFFINARTEWVAALAQWTIDLFQNQAFYGIFYFTLVVVFTYFYTSVIFHPDQISENLQKQGGFIPGIRPGRFTAEYLGKVTNRILLAGSLFLGLIAVLPLLMQVFTGTQVLVIGGTSILIVVSVVIETVKQVQSQLTMREYEGF